MYSTQDLSSVLTAYPLHRYITQYNLFLLLKLSNKMFYVKLWLIDLCSDLKYIYQTHIISTPITSSTALDIYKAQDGFVLIIIIYIYIDEVGAVGNAITHQLVSRTFDLDQEIL
jgi:hypothetical protein